MEDMKRTLSIHLNSNIHLKGRQIHCRWLDWNWSPEFRTNKKESPWTMYASSHPPHHSVTGPIPGKSPQKLHFQLGNYLCTQPGICAHTWNKANRIIMTSKYFLSSQYAKLQGYVVRAGSTRKAEPLLHPYYHSPHLSSTPLTVTESFSSAMAPHKISALTGEHY